MNSKRLPAAAVVVESAAPAYRGVNAGRDPLAAAGAGLSDASDYAKAASGKPVPDRPENRGALASRRKLS